MQEIEVLKEVFDDKLISVLRLFFQDSSKQFYLKELSGLSAVSLATTHRILRKLVRLGIINEVKISKFRVYQLAENEKTEFLASFIKQSLKVLELFVDMVKKISNVDMVVLHGKETDNRANILIIGGGISPDKIKAIATDVREKYNFTISYLTLAHDQYIQMSEMGLYSGKKKVLFER